MGAQTLINAGVANKVLALRDGTQGWHLAGLELVHGASQRAPMPTAAGLAEAQKRHCVWPSGLVSAPSV